MAIHKNQRVINGLHVAHAFEFANEAARLAFTPVSGDQYKLGLQLDNMSLHILTSEAPAAWAAVVPGDVPPHTHTGVYSPVTHSHANTEITGLGTASTKNSGTSVGEVPVLGVDGKLDANLIPAIAISDTFVVNSEAAMLALSSAETGDVAVRTDLSKSFILKGTPYSTLSHWQELLTPESPVQSVAGKVGVVTLSKFDVGLSNVDNTSDANKPVSSAVSTALSGKANSSHTHSGSDVTSQVSDSDMLDGKHASDFIQKDANGRITTSPVVANGISICGTDTSGNARDLAYISDTNATILGNSSHVTYVKTGGAQPYAKVSGLDYKMWHEGNDGPGSGLDADTLDGQHADAFEASGQSVLRWLSPSTAGTLDWSSNSATYPGCSNTLLMGNAANGPGPAVYYYCMVIGYGVVNGNLTQLAIPYYGGSNLYFRTRYGTDWSAWFTLWSSGGDGAVAQKIKTTAPANPTPGDIWIA